MASSAALTWLFFFLFWQCSRYRAQRLKGSLWLRRSSRCLQFSSESRYAEKQTTPGNLAYGNSRRCARSRTMQGRAIGSCSKFFGSNQSLIINETSQILIALRERFSDLPPFVTELGSCNTKRDIDFTLFSSSRIDWPESIVHLKKLIFLFRPGTAWPSNCFSLQCVCMVILSYKSAMWGDIFQIRKILNKWRFNTALHFSFFAATWTKVFLEK